MLLIHRVTRRLRRELDFVRRKLVNPPLPQRGNGPLLVHIGCGSISSPVTQHSDEAMNTCPAPK